MHFDMSDGVRISAETRGSETDPVALLLHGFPQSSHAWEREMGKLASDGFFAVAPDMRGYGKSDKPREVASYKSDRLALDVKEIVRALGREKVMLVAHDWGAVVAFMAAALHPDVVEKLVILNGPHPDAMKQALKRSSAQRRRSWYIFFFQLPLLPELLLKQRKTMELVLRGAKPDAFSPGEIATYSDAARAPGAARSMINYYRASARYGSPRLPKITVPTLVIWGEEDIALGTELLGDLDRYVESPQVERVANASHWVLEDEPEAVHAAISRFLKAKPG